ncbi:MAG: hypothetical protein IT436_00775 [Phycisphaerales bacterium]|nr:hypothetical protein [Phycisphaerales bacterium]
MTTLSATIDLDDARELMRQHPMAVRERWLVRAVQWGLVGAMVVMAVPTAALVALAMGVSGVVSALDRVPGMPARL